MWIKDLNLLYFHPPKTGGTSFEHMLGYKKRSSDYTRAINARDWFINYKHAFPEEMLELLGEETYFGAIKVATVRNPVDRAVSLYKHFYRHNWIPDDMSFIGFWNKVYKAELSVSLDKWYILSPQVDWIDLDTRLIRIEHLQEDLLELTSELGVQIPEILHHNPTTDKRSNEHLGVEQALDIIQELYFSDFELLK